MSDNSVTMEIEFDTKRQNLENIRKELEKVAAASAEAYRRKGAAAYEGGHGSLPWLEANKEEKMLAPRVKAAWNLHEKALKEYENRNAPLMKRVGGWVHKLMYGEKVDPANIDNEQRKALQRMSAVQRHMATSIQVAQNLAHIMAPLPGGRVAYAGIAGAAQGFDQATIDPETGLRRRGVMGLARGLAGGAWGAAATAGLALAARGVSGAISGGREEASLYYRMSKMAGGDTKAGRAGMGLVYGVPGMSTGEAANIAGGAFRAGGGRESARYAIRAEQAGGFGGEYTQMVGGMAKMGAPTSEIDANAKRLWIDMLATGTATGLQKGRIGELIANAQHLAGSRELGVKGDVFQVTRMLRALGGGKDSPYQGARGVEFAGKLEGFVSGQSSPMAHAMALMGAGLGSGTSYVEAMKKTEKGLFGKRGGENSVDSVQRVKDMVKRVSEQAGGDDDMATLLLSKMGGMNMTSAGDLLGMVQGGKFGEEDYKKMQEGADKTEQEAWNAMAGAAGKWDHIDKLIQQADKELGKIFDALGGTDALIALLTRTAAAVEAIAQFIGAVQKAKDNKVGAAIGEITGTNARRNEEEKQLQDWVNKRGGRLGTTKADDFLTSEEARLALDDAGGNKGGKVRAWEDKQGQTHLVIELRDEHDRLRIINVNDRSLGQPAQGVHLKPGGGVSFSPGRHP